MPKDTKKPIARNDKILTTDSTGRAFVGTVVAVDKDLVTVWPDQLPQLPMAVKAKTCLLVAPLLAE
jgi:hypothetical protein